MTGIKKMLSLLLAALMLFSFSLPVSADSINLKTAVPDKHTVTVICGAGGSITVSGHRYAGVMTLPFYVDRHGDFTLKAEADENYVLYSVTGSHAPGMTVSADGVVIPNVCRDATLSVIFKSTKTPAPDPDPVPDQKPTPSPSPSSGTKQGTEQGTKSSATGNNSGGTNQKSGTASSTGSTNSANKSTPEKVTVPGGEVTLPVTGETESITAEASLNGDTVAIIVNDEKLNELLNTDTGAKTVTFDVSQIEAAVKEVTLPLSTVKSVADQAVLESNDLTGLDFVMKHATVTFNAKALNSIIEQAKGETISLRVEEIPVGNLNDLQQQAVASLNGSAVIVEVSLYSGELEISDFNDGSAEIRLPHTPPAEEDTAETTVWHVAGDGTMEELDCRYENDFLLFTVSHFSNFLIHSGIVGQNDDAAIPGTKGSLSFIPILVTFVFLAGGGSLLLLRRRKYKA